MQTQRQGAALEQRFSQRSVAPPIPAELNFLGLQDGKPLFHTSDQRRSRVTLDPHVIPISDARSLADPTLDRDGFQLVRQPLPALDYADAAVRDGPYLIMVQDLLKEALGAAKVLADISILRLPGPDAFQKPILMVHSDYTPSSARRLLGECWDQGKEKSAGLAETAGLIAQSVEAPTEAERRYSRVMAINVWRTISMPPHDYPLAVCSRDSLVEDDIRAADFIEEIQGADAYEAEFSLCRYSPRQEWFSFSDMEPDEVLLFLGYDFAEPSRCGVMHAAFHDPGCPPKVPGRASVEVRTFAFFEG